MEEQMMLIIADRLNSASKMLYDAVNKKDTVNVLINVIRFLHIDLCNANCGIINESMKNRYLLNKEKSYAKTTETF